MRAQFCHFSYVNKKPQKMPKVQHKLLLDSGYQLINDFQIMSMKQTLPFQILINSWNEVQLGFKFYFYFYRIYIFKKFDIKNLAKFPKF
jgi:hypothetical protein